MRRAVIYARVSSEDQERHGYSIPGQLRLAREYCARHGLTASEADTFAETGSAKDAARPGFQRVLEHLRRKDSPQVLVLWDLDRATRNLHDFAALKDLWRGGVEIHLAAAGLVVTQEADPGIWMAIGHKAIAAEYEVERLSQRVKMGLGEKRKRGGWCHRAPLGYLNVGVGNRRAIEPDPERAPTITELFEAFATGGLTTTDLAELASRSGLRSREGRRLDHQAICRILRHPVYAGFVPDGKRGSRHGFRGGVIEADHEPLIDRGTWWHVQEILNARRRRTERAAPKTLLGGGIVRCARCGAAITGTVHRRKQGVYRYYACSRAIKGDGCEGYAGYIRESLLIEQVERELSALTFSPESETYVRAKVLETFQQERRRTQQKREAIRRRFDQIGRLMDAMYEEKILGAVSATDYERRARGWQRQRDDLSAQAEALEAAGRMSQETIGNAMDVLTDVPRVWAALDFTERRELLRVVSLKRELDGDRLRLTWAEPFDAVALAATADRAEEASGAPIQRRVVRLAREGGPSWKAALVEILSHNGAALARWRDAA